MEFRSPIRALFCVKQRQRSSLYSKCRRLSFGLPLAVPNISGLFDGTKRVASPLYNLVLKPRQLAARVQKVPVAFVKQPKTSTAELVESVLKAVYPL
jgi:hypothetical protein